jgi:hypothetical protein
MSGQTQLMLSGFASSNTMVKAGRLNVFAIPALVERINAEVSKLLQRPQFREGLMAQSIAPYPPLKPVVFQMVGDDLATWTRTVRGANVEMLD